MARAYLTWRLFRALAPLLLGAVIVLSLIVGDHHAGLHGGLAGAVGQIVHQAERELRPLVSDGARALTPRAGC